MERVLRFTDPAVRLGRSRIDFRRVLHGKRLMRSFVIELFQESVELGLLLQDVGARWPGGFFLQRQVHALMPPVLLRMTGPNAFDRDAQAQPPDRELQ